MTMPEIRIKSADAFLERLRAGIGTSGLKGRGIVAVSGGADSVALLIGLTKLQEECALQISVAHLNHRLRGEESERDAEFVEQLAGKWGVACDLEAVDVAGLVGAGIGVEETAREVRLEFYRRVARKRGAAWVATAHHLDDQAETVLHHLVRGTGLAGLRGIPRRRELAPGIDLVRPLLDISREALQGALNELGQEYRLDSSNESLEFTRNRIRLQVLPLLREFNPRVTESLGRLAAQAAEWEEFLNRSVQEFLNVVLFDESGAGYRLKRSEWILRPALLQQGALQELWKRNRWPRKSMSTDHFLRLGRMIQEGGKSYFPGRILVEVRDDLIQIHRGFEL